MPPEYNSLQISYSLCSSLLIKKILEKNLTISLIIYSIAGPIGTDQCPRGTHMLWHTGMYHTNGLLFHHKSLDVGPIFITKIPFHKNSKKIVKSAIYEVENPLEMSPNFRPWAAHHVKK